MDNQCVTDPDQRARAAAALARIVERDWPEGRKRQLPTVLLRALCDLAGSPESQGDDGWDLLAIAPAMVNLGAHWAKRIDKDARYRINSHWKNLEPLWSDRRDSVLERLKDDGFDLEPRLEKLPGGGAGNRTRYRLQFFPLPASVGLGSDTQADEVGEQQSLSVVTLPVHDTRGGQRDAASIRYYAVPLRLPGAIRRQPIDGLRMSGVMIYPLLTIGASISVLAFWAGQAIVSTLFHFLPVTQTSSLLSGSVKWALGTVIFLPFILYVYFAMIQLIRNHVSAWPPLLSITNIGDGTTVIELRFNPDDRRKQRLHVTSYVADCPICGADGNGRSSIHPASGGWEFHGRTVGRCIHAPQEHVWSFDHIARTGRFLR